MSEVKEGSWKTDDRRKFDRRVEILPADAEKRPDDRRSGRDRRIFVYTRKKEEQGGEQES